MYKHIPVLLNETIDGLNIKSDGVYVDATLGGGGHTLEILKRIDNGLVIGIDQDIDAIKNTKELLSDFIKNKKLIIEKTNFENIDTVLRKYDIKKIDGILFDLGVSSYQFDEGNRGFSYRYDAKLDMRMDIDNPLSCYELVNNYSETDLYKIIKEYGEDNFAKNIAKHIVINRESKPIETTFELVEIIKNAIPAKLRYGEKDKNPAKRTFQAFRMYINRELAVIEIALNKSIELMNDGGRICVITFHSIEDKLVKDIYRKFENPCTCPKGYPCVCNKKPYGRMIGKKGIVASEEEIISNKRAHSARLRIFEKNKLWEIK